MSEPNPYVGRFMALFDGLDTAYGTGEGRWVKEPPGRKEFSWHLAGKGPGLGIAPLKTDGTVKFAAIDLDEPNFELAKDLADLLPGTAFIERSRSGNAHVFVFFSEPIEAWVPRGIMREALAAYGRRNVEVFPKQDQLRPGMVGSYINLPYHGKDRPILMWNEGRHKSPLRWHSMEMQLGSFLDDAESNLNDPSAWRKRAHWLGVPSPQERDASGHREFGTQPYLHRCAEYAIRNHETNPVGEGHRAVFFFSMSKMLANCSQFSADEALAILCQLNDESPDPISEDEVRRIYENAERGQFLSTGCDDPLFVPYRDPECKIGQ
jgi:hypothetical protein